MSHRAWEARVGNRRQGFITMGPGRPPQVLRKASEELRILKQGPFSPSFSFLKTRRIQKAGTGKSPFTVLQATREIAAAHSESKETRPSTGKKDCWSLLTGATSGENIRESCPLGQHGPQAGALWSPDSVLPFGVKILLLEGIYLDSLLKTETLPVVVLRTPSSHTPSTPSSEQAEDSHSPGFEFTPVGGAGTRERLVINTGKLT